jgi:2'-phosphotransferase
LSRLLSAILRHKAVEFNIAIRPDGFVLVEDLFASGRVRRDTYTLEDLRDVTRNNDKQRFTMIEDESGWWIRANQGHSIAVPELELQEIDEASAAQYPCVVHGTYFAAWDVIKESVGLSRMARRHVHLAVGVPGEGHVISGMRSSSQVYVYIDMLAALRDGFRFFISTNGVILTPGDENGFLPRRYFSKVTDAAGRVIS